MVLLCVTDTTGLAQKNRDFETEILAEIIPLSFPIEKRTELGRHLGIPSITLHQIEQEALENPYSKETALQKIIYCWFDREKSASYATIMSIIFEKLENHTNYVSAYRESVIQVNVKLLGCCVTVADIPRILDHILTPETESRIAKVNVAQIFKLNVKEPGETQLYAKMQLILKSWLRQEKDNATWKNLVKNMEAVDKDAAMRVKNLQCEKPDKRPSYDQRRSVCLIISHYLHV